MLETSRVLRTIHRLIFAQFISGLGDALTTIGVMAVVLKATHDPLIASLGVICKFVVEASIGARMISKVSLWSRKKVLVGADLTRALLTLGIIAAASGGLHFSILFLLQALSSACGLLFNSAREATVSALADQLPEDRQQRVFSHDSSWQEIGIFLGAFLAGLLVLRFDYKICLALDVLTFLVSMAVLLKTEVPQRTQLDTTERRRGLSVAESWKILKSDRILFRSTICRTFFYCSGGYCDLAMLSLVTRFVSPTNPVGSFSIQEGVMSVGLAWFLRVLPRLKWKPNFAIYQVVGLLGLGCVMIGYANTRSFLVFCVIGFLNGVILGVNMYGVRRLRQVRTQDEHRDAIVSLSNLLARFGTVMGSLLAFIFVKDYVTSGFVLSGTLFFVNAFYLYSGYRRALHGNSHASV
jgi:predicted MFS family arabinose efflux permease